MSVIEQLCSVHWGVLSQINSVAELGPSPRGVVLRHVQLSISMEISVNVLIGQEEQDCHLQGTVQARLNTPFGTKLLVTSFI